MWYNIITVKDRFKSLKPEGIITMIICNNQKQFNQWVDDKVTSLDNFMSSMTSKHCKATDGKACGAIRGIKWKLGTSVVYGNFIITVKENGDTIIYNTRTRRRGEARLNLGDTMDYELGLALAWARYNHKEIPVVRATTKISDLKVGDVVSVSVSKNTNDNYIVLSIVPNIKETAKNDIAITFMEWDGKRSSFYYGKTRTVIKNKMGSMDVVDHVKF